MQNAAALVESAPKKPRRLLPQEIALSDIQSSTVQRGLDLWKAVRGTRSFPARSDLTPRMLSDLLRNTALVRVLTPGEEYELRIVGDTILQAQGRSFQGMSMAEIDLILPGHGMLLRKTYNTVCGRHAPMAFRGWYTREADQRTMFQEMVLTPLSTDGQVIDHILIFGTYVASTEDTRR